MAQGTTQKSENIKAQNLLAHSGENYSTSVLIPPKHKYDLRKETN